jgi:hypothetical protein
MSFFIPSVVAKKNKFPFPVMWVKYGKTIINHLPNHHKYVVCSPFPVMGGL